MKLVVGQKVFLKKTYRHNEPNIRETTVTKVGKKYFEIEGSWDKFHLSGGLIKSEYTPQEKVYESMEAIKEEDERSSLVTYLSRNINSWELSKLSLEKLKNIKAIIESI